MRVQHPFCVEKISKITWSGCWMSPTGRFLAISDYDECSTSFVDTKMMNRCGPDSNWVFEISSAAWSSTEDHIVTSSADGTLRKGGNIFKAPTLVAQSTQKLETAFLEFSPDDRFIASFYFNGAKLLDASNLSLICEYPGVWLHVAFHPFGNRVVFYSGHDLLLDVKIGDLGNVTVIKRQFNYQ